MNEQNIFYSALLCVVALISLVVATIVWHRRSSPGGWALVIYMTTGGQTPDCANSSPTEGGGIYSGGYNLIGDTTGCGLLTATTDLLNQNAWLELLADNGGSTQTHALGVASPAIDLIPAASCPLLTDQRGLARPLGEGCDIGAYETVGHRLRLPLIFKN